MCNQMFQYAFGYVLAKKYGDMLVFDVDFYANQPGHVGKRGVIGKNYYPNLSMLELCTRPTLVKIFENKYISHLIRYHSGGMFLLPGVHFMMERLHKYYKCIPYKVGTNNYYDGSWQTARYFAEYSDEIRREFSPNDEVQQKVTCWRKSILAKNCIAVHIRRGDYMNKINQATLHEGNVIGDVEYYLRAIHYMKQHVEYPVFCFFSDDIEWCKETFSKKLPYAVFVENSGKQAAMLDLFSIAECEHGIMSPSTFSWWGNWLRDHRRDSIVIGPKGEYSNEYFMNENWIKM